MPGLLDRVRSALPLVGKESLPVTRLMEGHLAHIIKEVDGVDPAVHIRIGIPTIIDKVSAGDGSHTNHLFEPSRPPVETYGPRVTDFDDAGEASFKCLLICACGATWLTTSKARY